MVSSQAFVHFPDFTTNFAVFQKLPIFLSLPLYLFLREEICQRKFGSSLFSRIEVFKKLNSVPILPMMFTLCWQCRPDDNSKLVSIPLLVTNGVYLEKWDRIDYKRVKFLLADPRYPNLPSFATCVPTFEQPSNWGDFFGSRLRTYFVPLQTGNHYFYLCK